MKRGQSVTFTGADGRRKVEAVHSSGQHREVRDLHPQGTPAIQPVKGGFRIGYAPCSTCGEPPFGSEYCCGHQQ